ncbi:MAG: epoxyqueuosine reductase QueH [Patescibacteria group bacterium]
MNKPRLLLHTCCAPCSGFLARELSRDFAVSIYFDNPNIFPEAEYQHRLEEVKNFFRQGSTPFMTASYDHLAWLKVVSGLENEPERGKRCLVCYRERLKNTAKFAKDNDFDYFASTLAISPYKDASAINAIGQELERELAIKFLAGDWKKQDRFKQAMTFSRERGFYHQHYCGCEFSLN